MKSNENLFNQITLAYDYLNGKEKEIEKTKLPVAVNAARSEKTKIPLQLQL